MRVHSFIHSFYFYGASSSPLLLRGAPDSARIGLSVPELHAEAPQAIVSKGLARCPYVAARAGGEPMIFGRKASTLPKHYHAPHSTVCIVFVSLCVSMCLCGSVCVLVSVCQSMYVS